MVSAIFPYTGPEIIANLVDCECYVSYSSTPHLIYSTLALIDLVLGEWHMLPRDSPRSAGLRSNVSRHSRTLKVGQ